MAGQPPLPPNIQNLLVDRSQDAAFSDEQKSSAARFASTWAEHARRVSAEAPYAVVEDGGETIYTHALSPGCQACKSGAWDCLFLTQRCNLACSFCCSPSLRRGNVPLSALGRDIDELIANFALIQPRGVSFSGGEAFLEFDRLRELALALRQAFPAAYLWVYTNGRLASAERLADLGELGIDEIRFNLAATGYSDAAILQRVEQASRSIPNVTVEIPAIPEDAEKLLAAMEIWSRLGVRFLNLHELMYEPGSLSADLPGPRMAFTTPDGHTSEFDPRSRELVLRVLRAAHDRGLPLAVNDCSMHNKLRQLRGRRSLVGRLVERMPSSSETLDEDGFLQTVCAFSPVGDVFFLRPEDYAAVHGQPSGMRCLRLRRLPPLSIYEQKHWELVEELGG